MSAPAKMTAVRSGSHAGVEWAICAAPMPGFNGYVRIPAGHPWFGKNYDDIPVEVHYGLTFGDNDGWIGFDTLHSGDVWGDDALSLGAWDQTRLRFREKASDSPWSRTWTLDLLEAEVRSLADQVARSADRSPSGFQALYGLKREPSAAEVDAARRVIEIFDGADLRELATDRPEHVRETYGFLADLAAVEVTR